MFMKKFFTKVLPIFLVGIVVGGGIVLGTVYRAEHAMNLNLIEENAKLKEKISDEDIDDDKRAKSKSFSIDGEQVSDEIFLGVSFGETGFGTEVEFVPAEVRFFTDGDVVLYLDDEECYITHIDDFDDIMNDLAWRNNICVILGIYARKLNNTFWYYENDQKQVERLILRNYENIHLFQHFPNCVNIYLYKMQKHKVLKYYMKVTSSNNTKISNFIDWELNS